MRQSFAAASAALIVAMGPSGAAHAASSDAVRAASSSEAAQLQQAIEAGRKATGAPGVSAAIVLDGRFFWSGQSGSADIAGKVPITGRTLFALASVSKMFVATIAMRLVERGKLRLDEPIDRYVPSYLPDASRVTVLELLGHTSGYRDDEDDPVILKLLDDPNHAWTRDQLERREGPPRFTPGSRFSYCNSCYVTLGGVIEQASGSTIGALLDRFIVEPLDLSDDVGIDRNVAFAARFSRGYDLHGGVLVDTFKSARDLGVPTYDWGPVWTDGGVVATAAGVARFTDALFGGSLVTQRSLATMLAPGGKNVILESDRYDGKLWRGHSGFYDGFTAEAWYDARRRVTIVVLTNRTDDNDPATLVWNRLASTYDRLRP